MDEITLPPTIYPDQYLSPASVWKRKSGKILLGLGIFLVVTIAMAVKASALCSGQFEVTAYREERTSGDCGPYRDGLYADQLSGGGCPVEGEGGSASADPAVIPQGTRINIEGVGERVVGDTGGAVTGHIVDFFIADNDEAWDFGRKFNVTITWPGCGGPPPPPPPPPPQENPPVGNIDPSDCTGTIPRIRGWSFDPDKKDQSLNHHVHIDGQGPFNISTGDAILRTDVNNNNAGVTGNHGFEWQVPSQFQDGNSHNFNVDAFGINSSGSQDGLNAGIGSGSFGPCGGSPPPPPVGPPPPPPVGPPPPPPPGNIPAPLVDFGCVGAEARFTVRWSTSNDPSNTQQYYVDVAPDTSFSENNYWNKGPLSVGTTSTPGPSGFNRWPGGGAMPALDPNINYYARIYYEGPNIHSATSASFRVSGCTGNPPPPPPQQPSDLTLTPQCSGSVSEVHISWDPPPSGTVFNRYSIMVKNNSAATPQWFKGNMPTSPRTSTAPTDGYNAVPSGAVLTGGTVYEVKVGWDNVVGGNTTGSIYLTKTFRANSCDAPPADDFPAPSVSQKCVGSIVKADFSWSQSKPPANQYFVDVGLDSGFGGGYWNRDGGTSTTMTDAPDGFGNFGGSTGSLVFNPGTNYFVRVYYRGPDKHSAPVSFTARSDCAAYENTLNLTPSALDVYPGDTVQVFVNLRNIGNAPSPVGTTHVVFNTTDAGPPTAPAPTFVSSITTSPTACGTGPNGAGNFTSFARNTPEYCEKPTLGNYDGTRNLWQIDFGALPAKSSIAQATIDLPIRNDAPAGTFCLSAYWDPAKPGAPPGRTDAAGLPGDGVCIQVLSVDRPYSAFYGTDLHAGSVLAGSANPESCNIVTPPPAGLKGQHYQDGSTHLGTRSQYGTSATGAIVDTGSNRRPPLDSTASELLIFANLIGGAVSRGEIPHRVICRPDYTKISTTLPDYTASDTASIADFVAHMGGAREAVIKWQGSGSGQKRLSGDGVVPANRRLTIISLEPVVVDTDVFYVSSGANPSFSSRSAIPAFALVSNSNIAITPSVKALTGLYAANGILSTCSTSALTASLNTPSLATAGNACRDNRLDIYGVVHASTFYFRRLAGDARNQVPSSNDNTSSERIIATPELWLQSPPGFGTEAFSSSFKADLPPLF